MNRAFADIKSFYIFCLVFALSATLLSLVACGDRKSLEGEFLDSAVQGLRYVSNTFEGSTGANGKFSFREGEEISFYLGDLLLGKATAKAKMTPLDLVTDATSVSNHQVSNIARLLQTLDDNDNTADGILIPTLATTIDNTNIDFTLATSLFSLDPNVSAYITGVKGSGATLVSAATAQAHLQSTIDDLSTSSSLIISAGSDLSASSGTVVTLTASLSGDFNDFSWAASSNNSINVIITYGSSDPDNNLESTQIQFATPTVSSTTELVFILTVEETDGTNITDSVTVTVTPT